MVKISKNKKIAVIFLFFLQFCFLPIVCSAAFLPPTANPPNNNSAALLNVSDLVQIRRGPLYLAGDNSQISFYGLVVEKGSVGIGTNLPSNILTVGMSDTSITQSTTAILNIFNNNTTANNYANIAFGQSGAGSNSFSRIGVQYVDRTGGSEDQDIIFGTIGAGSYGERMRILSTGNVGIGTTVVPTGLSFGRTRAAISVATSDGTDDGSLVFDSGGGGISSTRGALMVLRGNEFPALGGTVEIQAGNSGTMGTIGFNTGAGLRRMTINSSGYVGIGSTTPYYLLAVSGGTGMVQSVAGGRITGVGDAVVNADALSLGRANALFSPAIPGTTGQTLRHNGTSWAANSVLYNNGTNIGIGTTNPRSLLQIDNSTSDPLKLRIHTELGTVDSLAGLAFGVDTANQYMKSAITHQRKGSNGQGDLVFLVDTNTDGANVAIGDEKMRIQGGTGNVGIGITPEEKLHIYNSAGNASIRVDVPATSDWAFMNFRVAGGAPTRWELGKVGGADSRTGNFYFYHRSGAQVDITPNGNVGIGTIAPGMKLHLSFTDNNGIRIHRTAGVVSSWDIRPGNIGAGDLDFWDNVAGASRMIINGSGNVGIGNTNPTGAKLVLSTPTGAGFTPLIYLQEGTADYGFKFLQDDAVSGDMRIDRVINGTSNTVMTFARANGNVGIGTTAPGLKLHLSFTDNNGIRIQRTAGVVSSWDVRPGNYGAGDLDFWDNVAGASRMIINGSGNVGIGETAPSHTLTVSGLANNSIFWGERVRNISTAGVAPYTSGAGIMFSLNEYPAVAKMSGVAMVSESQWGNSVGLRFYTGNDLTTSKMAITSAGNVGIGTTDPGAYRLNVVGDAKISGKLELGGADVAEEFITDRIYPAGTVLVMGDDGYKSAKPCIEEYDITVVGAISDQASVVMGQVQAEHKATVAIAGIIKIRVNNSNGQIKKGDLLVTSKIKGEAMKSGEYRPGTIIGKALEDLNSKKGEIEVLVNLQ